MKKILLAITFAVLVGCEQPAPENRCCSEGGCGVLGALYMEEAKCLARMVNDLEKKLEIMELKMRYECGEAK